MRCSTKGLGLPVVVLIAGCLAAGCGSAAQSAISNLPSRTATISATPGLTSTAAPGVTSTETATATATATSTATATATVTATATPSTPVTTPAAITSPTAATGSGSGTSLVWLWILLGVAVLAGLIMWIVRSARHRSAATAEGRSRLIDAYAEGSALHDAMSVAEAPGEFASGNAGARWADIQRRADDLTQTLYSLRETVPDDLGRARIEDTLTSLQAVRSAMDAERIPGGADPRQAEVVRNRLYSFEMSLRALRAGDQEYH
jgi:hypothetical protein